MAYINFDKQVILDLRGSTVPYVDLSDVAMLADGVDLSNSSVLQITTRELRLNLKVLKLRNCQFLHDSSFIAMLPALEVLDIRGTSI